MGSASSIRRREVKLSAKESSQPASADARRVQEEAQDAGPHQVSLEEEVQGVGSDQVNLEEADDEPCGDGPRFGDQGVGSDQVNLEEADDEPCGEGPRFGEQSTRGTSQMSDQDKLAFSKTITSSSCASAPFPPELDEGEMQAFNLLQQFQSWKSDPALEEDYSNCYPPPCLPAMRRQHMEHVKKLDEYLDTMVAAQAHIVPMEELSRKQQLLAISPKFLRTKLWMKAELARAETPL